VRVRPYSRYAAVLTVALAAVSGGVAEAAPLLPTVTVPSVPGAPAPVNQAVGQVNGVTSGVTDTVNNTVQTVGDTLGGATENPPVVTNPIGGGSTPPPGPAKTNTSTPTGGSSGAGNGPAAPAASTPSASGGSGQTRRRSAARRGGLAAAPSARARARRARAARRAAARRPAAAARAAQRRAKPAPKADEPGNPVARVINRIEEVVPGPVKVLIGALALVALLFGVNSWLATRRARRLARQREELLGDVGLLQRALLPDVPADLRGIDVSVAYRPAEGPAAGGDFYDVFELDGGRTAIIVGDVCGHGRAALAVTALMRYTLRAYAAAGFEPRVALQVAARALDGDPDGALTTVVLAVYDPSAGTLTYACAGHEPPIVLGPAAYEPVTTFSAPPLGGFTPTGQRQTTVALPPGSSACFFTDGLVEARAGDAMIGRKRLTELLGELEPDCGAQLLLERVASAADRAPDDMAACLVRASGDAADSRPFRLEELEADAHDLHGERAEQFLAACGVAAPAAADALRLARAKAAEFGGAVIRVRAEGPERTVDVAPREDAKLPVPPLDDAGRRAALELPRA
jgi:serine phosphatase RsbU (regulator of sigma subunit)